jgi:hypothetical protein
MRWCKAAFFFMWQQELATKEDKPGITRRHGTLYCKETAETSL